MNKPSPHKMISALTLDDKNYIFQLEQYCSYLEEVVKDLDKKYRLLNHKYLSVSFYD